MKKVGKKTTTVVVVLCMIFSLMPQIVPKAAALDTPTRTAALNLTASSVTYAGGAGTGNSTANITDTSEGWAWYYTAADGHGDKTLVLDGLNLVTADAIALTLPADTTIVLAEDSENIVTSTYSNNGSSYGIKGLGSLTIRGSGILDIAGGNPSGDYLSAGIYLQYAENERLTIEDDAAVSASGGNNQFASYGIKTNGSIYFSDATVTACGGDTQNVSYGICAENGLAYFSNATVTATGGTARLTCGLNAVIVDDSGSCSFGSGTVLTVTGGTGGTSIGMQLVRNGSGTIAVVENDATVTAISGPEESFTASGSYSTGISLYNKVLEVKSGGSVTATCNSDTPASVNSYGIYGGILLNGGTVTASSGDTMRVSYGVYGGPVQVNSGTLTATGGSGLWGSYGIYCWNSSSNFAGGITTAKSAGYYAVYADNGISDAGMTVKQNNGSGSYTIPASQSPNGIYYVCNDNVTATDVLISSGPVASAAVEDATVSGCVGTALPGSDTVTVTLTGCAFTGFVATNDVSAWFANLPDGLAVAVQSVASDNHSAVLAFSGTPTETSDAAMTITIPGEKLDIGSDIAVTGNTAAKFSILQPTTPSFAASGDGSADDPYEIGNADQLKELSKFVNTQNADYGDKYYMLTDDIVLNTDLSGSPEQWTPIGATEESIFTGVFDGNGHTISGLYINDTKGELDFVGLFGLVMDATIKNLGLTGGSITAGESATGGIVAFGVEAHVENCYNGCTISALGNHARAGGIIGVNSKGGLTVINCYNTGRVTAAASEDGDEACAGGIAGLNIESSIRNCYNAGAIIGNAVRGAVAYAGAIAGRNDLQGEAVIENNYFLDSTAANGIGYDETEKIATDAGCVSKTQAELKSAAFVQLLNNNVSALQESYPNLSVWRSAGAAENDGYPVFGTAARTFTLTISGGGTGAAGGGDYEEGASVPISAGARSNYIFSGWTTSGGGALADADSADTTFTMPGEAITLTANWTENAADNYDLYNGNSSDAKVLVNSRPYAAGTLQTSSDPEGRPTATVTVDTKKLTAILALEERGATVTVPISGEQPVKSGVLTGEMVKSMENQQAILEIRADNASYTIPADEIDIDAVSRAFGTNVALSDIMLRVSISEATRTMATIVANTASEGGFTVKVPAVDFTITCSYNEQTVNVSTFRAYVRRIVAIPDGVDPNKITTAVVVNPDGTVHHVPTQVTVIDGKYYAVINSLTNSTYTVIWHPIEFADVTSHWAKDAINDMGSRMVVTGVGNNYFEPDRNITRAEFASIVVRALGLGTGKGSGSFTDVRSTEWYYSYLQTAVGYGIITGKDDGTFGPNDLITREQAMVMTARAMKLTGLESGSAGRRIGDFSDGAFISDYAEESVTACLNAGLVNGRGNTTLAPADFVTRAEAAVLVERLLKNSGLI